MLRLETSISELQTVSQKAFKDSELISDDGSEFPQLTPMKHLKVSLQNVATITGGLAKRLTSIKEQGSVS